MKHIVLLPLLMLVLCSCAVIDRVRGRPAEAAPAVRTTSDLPGTASARTAEALDTSSAAEKTAALSAGASGGAELGSVVVSLGSPAEQGFWLRSSLVAVAGKGRVVTDQGASVAVDLLPGEAAAQLSLPAFRALGLPLTGLPVVTVYAD